MKKTLLAVSLLCVSLAACEDKDPYKKATFAYLVKDYPTAYAGFVKLAGQGNVDAQQYLGSMLQDGKGVAPDAKQALYWYQKAAEQGKVESQMLLGVAYYNGGNLVAQDFALARHWYMMAAEGGNRNAQLQLAVMDHIGQGGPADDVSAYKWLILVASTSQDTLRDNRVVMDAVRMQDELSGRLTEAQVEKAKSLAELWRTQHPGDNVVQ
jgi:TPR repeat protein